MISFVQGFSYSYLVNSNGGVKTNFFHVLGRYVQTGETTNFPGQKCNPRLPIYKHESRNTYLYVQCNHWVIADKLHHNVADIFALKTEVNSVPTVKSWRYRHKGKVQSDTTMRVKRVAKGKKLFNYY